MRSRVCVSEVNLSKDLIEDMWLGVSVVSQAPPGGRVLVSLPSVFFGDLTLVVVLTPSSSLTSRCVVIASSNSTGLWPSDR